MTYIFENYELHPDLHELRKNGCICPIEPQVFDLLLYLVENRDRTISKDELNERIWNGRIVSDDALSSCLKSARRAVGDNGKKQAFIRTFPRRGIRFVGMVKCDDQNVSPDISSPDKPAIAVLPFDDMSADGGQEYFADGIAEDVITALSRFRSFFVTARNSSFSYKGQTVDIARVARELGVRYVVEGSVRKAGDRVRISAQLIDATSGNHLWADQFDGDLEDVFDLQDRITEQIVVAVGPEISARERERARRRAPGNLDAWELVQHGLSYFQRFNMVDRVKAIDLFKDAIKLDPEFAAAHAHLADAYWIQLLYTDREDLPQTIASARAAAERAVSLDPHDPVAHLALGRMHVVTGEIDSAFDEIRNAIALNPNHAQGHHLLGWAYHFGAGQAEAAIPHYDVALRLSIRDPLRWTSLMMKGSALSFLRRHEEAISHCRQACQYPNGGFLPHMHLAAALGEAGNREKSAAVIGKIKELEPAFTIDFVRSRFVGRPHPAFLDNLLGSLRKAGAPE